MFGSHVKAEASDSSDIDLYIDTKGKLKGLDFVGLLETLVNSLGVNVDLIDKSHIEPGSGFLQEIENGGLIIYEKPENHYKIN